MFLSDPKTPNPAAVTKTPIYGVPSAFGRGEGFGRKSRFTSDDDPRADLAAEEMTTFPPSPSSPSAVDLRAEGNAATN